MMKFLTRFLADDEGSTAIEYALIAVGLSLAIVAAAPAVGTAVSGMFNQIAGYL
jgi:pilus assembly protein Flp/PilA